MASDEVQRPFAYHSILMWVHRFQKAEHGSRRTWGIHGGGGGGGGGHPVIAL
jgi:hypothetical protein